MAPIKPPPTLPAWAKALWQAAPYISIGLQAAVDFFDDLQTESGANPAVWTHWEARFLTTGATNRRDYFYTSWDIANYTNGGIDPTWGAAELDAVHTDLAGLITAWMAFAGNNLHCDQLVAYKRTFSDLPTSPPTPDKPDKPFIPSGPPLITYPQTMVGGALGAMGAAQIAFSVTEKTPYPRHWGRNYWPGPGATAVDATGHFTNAMCDSMATSTANFYANLVVQGFTPVVPVVQIEKAPARALLNVTSIQVDNVPDVIRRRRPANTTYRAVKP